MEYIRCHKIMYLLYSCSTLRLVELSKGSTQNQPKYRHLNQGVQNSIIVQTFLNVHINVKLLQSQYSAVSTLKIPNALIALDIFFRDVFQWDSARLKLTLDSCIFTRCLNVPLLRLRTTALCWPLVHGARQCSVYLALAVFNCMLVVLLWLWPEAL